MAVGNKAFHIKWFAQT